jgi:LytS/YehU family sensor histidine kinase
LAISAFWPLIGSTSIALRFALHSIAGIEPRPKIIFIAIAGWIGWGLIVPLIVLVASAFPRIRRVKAFAAHCTAMLLATILHGTILLSIQQAVLGNIHLVETRALPDILPTIWVFGFLVYISTIIAAAALSNARVRKAAAEKEERLRAQLISARLELIKRRIQPRFFFRALETLALTIERDRDDAEQILTSLSRFLRHALRQEEARVASFDEELDVLSDFVAVEEARARRHITIRAEIDGDELPHLPRAVLTQLAEIMWPEGDTPSAVILNASADGAIDRVSVRVTGAHSSIDEARIRLEALRSELQLSPEVEIDATINEHPDALELSLSMKHLVAAMEQGAA